MPHFVASLALCNGPHSVCGVHFSLNLNKPTSYLSLCLSLNFFCDETSRTGASLGPETMGFGWVWVLAQGFKSQSEVNGFSFWVVSGQWLQLSVLPGGTHHSSRMESSENDSGNLVRRVDWSLLSPALSWMLLFLTALGFTFTTRHIHNRASFPLWPSCFILSGAINNCSTLFPSSISDTFQPGGLIFWCLSFCLFILSMGFSKQEYRSGLPFPPPGDHILSELFTVTHLG